MSDAYSYDVITTSVKVVVTKVKAGLYEATAFEDETIIFTEYGDDPDKMRTRMVETAERYVEFYPDD